MWRDWSQNGAINGAIALRESDFKAQISMTITKLRPTFTFDPAHLDTLRTIAPEASADGKINCDTLLEALGERLDAEGLDDESRDAEQLRPFLAGQARRAALGEPAGRGRAGDIDHAA